MRDGNKASGIPGKSIPTVDACMAANTTRLPQWSPTLNNI